MTNSGDAAEQVVRLSLEGFEVAARLTGSAAKNIAILLASVLKQEATQANKTRGKARLTNMIKSGKELKVFSIPNKDLKKFTEQAKRYGVLYCVLRDKNTRGDNVPIDIIARAEDASKIQRIVSVAEDLNNVKVGLEATGHYNYNLLGFLLDKGLPTYVINPLHTNLYRKSLSLRKTKTDKVDSRTIATMIMSDLNLKSYSDTVSYTHLTLPTIA